MRNRKALPDCRSCGAVRHPQWWDFSGDNHGHPERQRIVGWRRGVHGQSPQCAQRAAGNVIRKEPSGSTCRLMLLQLNDAGLETISAPMDVRGGKRHRRS